MTPRLLFLLECSPNTPDTPPLALPALARIVDAHPALSPLLDFCAPDPAQIALAIGMVHPGDEDGIDDLEEVDLGPGEWFEPSAGLAATGRALDTVRSNPGSIAEALYDPGLQPQDVIADLERLQQALADARQRETRFCLHQEA